jgi:hypothetical protein
MIQIVLAEVVLRQICDVGELDMRDVFRSQYADVHFARSSRSLLLLWVLGAVTQLTLGEKK